MVWKWFKRMKYGKKNQRIFSSLYVIFLLIGFGLGYIAKEFSAPHPSLPSPSSQSRPLDDVPVSVCFTPNKKCQSQIVHQIDKAVKSIYVQAYSFTDQDIAHALVGAFKRGVDVKVILDKSNRNDGRSVKDILIQRGVPLRFDSPNGIAHNKIIIVDENIIITGSYNFSVAAYKRNTENLLILSHSLLANEYLDNWQTRWAISQ